MHMPLQESHIHSYHTSTYWGGITGGAEIITKLPHTVSDVKIKSNIDRNMVHIDVTLNEAGNDNKISRCLITNVYDQNGELVCTKEIHISNVEIKDVKVELFLGDNARYWSTEDPYLYELELVLTHDGDIYDRQRSKFGFRTIDTSDNQILLNGKPVFLTGYVDCCIFPQTGYPVWDIDYYRKQFKTVKEYGFNHVRLHGWNPPEPFWRAADEEGMLVQTELPNWSQSYNNNTEKADSDLHAFLKEELKRIIESLNAHPSFVMLSMGNELISEEGHFQLNQLVKFARELDSSRIYTDNTGHGLLPSQSREGDFYIPSLNWHPPYNIDHAATEDTTTDYNEVTRLEKKPIIAHEHGQFTMYVRPEEEKKYQGVLEPHWLRTINKSLMSKGFNTRINEFIEATGIHLVRSLKENMEKARRTKGLSGIQLLDVRDFPGQGHATVGILDMFWDSKNIVDPKKFRQFNDQTVLLMRSDKRTYYSDEELMVKLELSHFGEPIDSAKLNWKLVIDEGVLKQGEVTIRNIPGDGLFDLVHIQESIQLKVAKKITLATSIHVNGEEYSNEWDFWMYPRQSLPEKVDRIWTNINELRSVLYGARIEETLGINELSFKQEKDVDLAITDQMGRDVLQYLVDGGNVWLMAKENGQYDEVITRYLPTFWNYLWFPEQVGTTMGMKIHNHPVTDIFPNDGYSDWNWYHLVDRTIALNLELTPNVKPIIEVIDNFHRAKRLAYVYEVKVGAGKLFVTTFNLTDRKLMKRPESHYLFFQIIKYLRSNKFQPATSITIGQLLGTFKVKSLFKLKY